MVLALIAKCLPFLPVTLQSLIAFRTDWSVTIVIYKLSEIQYKVKTYLVIKFHFFFWVSIL